MTTLSDALARVPNPLAAHTVSDAAADSSWVDVVTLHPEARQVLWQGGERARRGHSQVLALVGEAGSGKSHLGQWLRQELALRGDPQTYFISMPALPDLAQPFRHALRQLVGALCRKDSTLGAADSGAGTAGLLDRPIDVLLWGALYNQTYDLLDAARVGMYQVPAALLKLLGPMCHDAGRKRRLEDFVAAAQKVWAQVEPGLRSYLLSLPTEMSIDSAARAVLLQFPYADRRALCTAWLAGEELAQKDREKLGAKQVINNENAAKYVLASVVRLLTAVPGAQLIILYDQAEQLAEQLGQPGVQAMAEVAAAIQSSGGSSLQVLCVQPSTFAQLHDRPTRTAAGPGTLRHVDQTVRLTATPPELLRELVTARLAAGLPEATERPSVVYPFTEADLDLGKWPKEAATPRAALQVFAKRYSQRVRELSPGSPVSVPNAVSSSSQRRPAVSGPSRAKDAPSATGTAADRKPASAQSPTFDFLSGEATSDGSMPSPISARGELGKKPRSLTHPDESGAAATAPKPAAVKITPPKAGMPRNPQAFSLEDSSPTVQALPKEVVAAALLNSTKGAKELVREAKLNPAFAADSSPTVRALSDDIMGRVRGAVAASKAAAAQAAPAPAPAAPAPAPAPAKAAGTPAMANRNPLATGENVVMGRVQRPAKAPEAVPPAAEKTPDKAPDKSSDKPSDKAPDKLAIAVPTAIKTPDGLLVTRKTDLAVPDFEADSSPTLRRMPDENLIKASRDGSRPHTGPLFSRSVPITTADSNVSGRATPTLQTQPSLIHATRPSTAPAKPATLDNAATKPPLAKPPAVVLAPAAKAPVVEAPPAISNVPDPLPPSAESPSISWLAMASGQDPLADAVKQARQDLAITGAPKSPASLAEPPRPTPGAAVPTPPSSPAAPKTGPISARTVSAPIRASAMASAKVALKPMAKTNPPAAIPAPLPPVASAPIDNVPTELPPSAESPSISWLAMASGSHQLDDAINQAKSDLPSAAKSDLPSAAKADRPSAARSDLPSAAKADLPSAAKAEPAPPPAPAAAAAAPVVAEPPGRPESGPTPAARAARPVRDSSGLGVVVVNSSTVKPPEPVADAEPAKSRAPARSTLARMPAIQLRTPSSVSPQQVLSALAARGMMEDWQLAQELGLMPDALEKTLLTMEEEGQLRLMAMGDGQRMVVLID